MRVLFVYPNVVRYPKDISLGISYLSAVLKKHGHETGLIDTTFGIKDSEIVSKVKAFNPDLIGMSFVSAAFPYATHIATIIKKENKAPIIAGGVHPTVDPEETLSLDCFDMVCIGEGEEALLELVTSIEKTDRNTAIQNIWFKENGRIIRNSFRELCKHLDTLPYPDLDIYDYSRYLKDHYMAASFLRVRGCPYECTYCANHTFKELYKGLGTFVRYRSIDNIIGEIKSVVQRHQAQVVNFYDDTFTLNKKQVSEFCAKYKKEIGLPFSINGRIDNITRDMCAELRSAGCSSIFIGLESGDPSIRQNILKKNITNESIIEGCRLLKEYGIPFGTYNMIGIPGEKMQDIRKTIALNRKIRPDSIVVTLFNAYKGTELYLKCKKEGILDKAVSYYWRSSNVRHPYLSLRKLQRLRKWFGFHVFIAYNPKKAFVDLIDSYFMNTLYYTRLRTLARSMLKHLFRSNVRPT